MQVTSPNLQAKAIDACLQGLDCAPIAATAVELGCKPNGILLEMAPGVWGQALPQLGAPSVARQRLPQALRLTGAVTAFHADALAFPSLFHAGRIMPVVVGTEEALDVDTPEDLKEAQKEEVSHQ